MPTYEYKCDNCGHEFEVYQSMKDDKLTKCPSCGQNKLKRLIGAGGGLIFKGSGFYLTDYKNKSAESTTSETKKKESKHESTPSSTDTTKADTSKTATKITGDSKSKQPEKKGSKVKTDKE